MTNPVDIGSNFHRDIAFDNLAVVKVHLQRCIFSTDAIQGPECIILSIEIVTRYIARIDGFKQHRYAVHSGTFSCQPDIFDIGALAGIGIGVCWWDASHDV